jgi:pimeloyl-ACP methyl ester carboxylesterase
MVDVGGYRLHINCVGTGSPTVVIESGWGDWSAAWSSWVQPAAARTTRVCTYDRAGYGFSEPGPLPRTAERFAQELHTLLHEAGIPGPYVLAGHSMGGLTVRLYAHEYPTDVAGVVLIDSMSPSAAEASEETNQTSDGDGILRLPARIGLLRLLTRPLGLSAPVSPEVAGAYNASSVTPSYVQTYFLDEGRGMPASLAQAGRVSTLGDIPLIVLSRGLDQQPQWMARQAELLRLSSNSQQLFATHSGHNIEFDDPESAVGAIAQMVEHVRGH